MKKVTVILFILLFYDSYSQLDKLKGTWISKNNDLIVISDTANKTDNSNLLCTANKDEGFYLYLVNNILSFQKQYYSSATNYNKLYTDKYDFQILKLTEKTLVVKPISKFASKFYNYKKQLQFTKQKFNIDTTIKFKKIVYHTTHCFGTCPMINLEINEDGSFYFNAEFQKEYTYMQIDSLKTGRFNGRLDSEQLSELITILQTSNLKTLTFPERTGADGPTTTLIIYYNNRRKYLKSMFPPTIAEKIIEYLYLVTEKAKYERTDDIREIET
jgi:hypothetical protein